MEERPVRSLRPPVAKGDDSIAKPDTQPKATHLVYRSFGGARKVTRGKATPGRDHKPRGHG